jgi:hypothetical protein
MAEKKWRLAKLGDRDAIAHMHDEQQALLGMNVDRPDLFDKPVLLAMVLDDGKVNGGFYLEAVGECCFIGIDPETTVLAKEIAPQVCNFLRLRGIRWLRTFIPKGLDEVLGPQLKEVGYEKKDDELCHYALDLRVEETANGA